MTYIAAVGSTTTWLSLLGWAPGSRVTCLSATSAGQRCPVKTHFAFSFTWGLSQSLGAVLLVGEPLFPAHSASFCLTDSHTAAAACTAGASQTIQVCEVASNLTALIHVAQTTAEK